MKKIERRNLIKKLIKEKKIGTQDELSQSLIEIGVETTQGTLSRDIKELGIVKNRTLGRPFYTILPSNVSIHDLASAFLNHASSVSDVMFMVVVHTPISEADILANILDESGYPGILGTIAGADTLLITCASVEVADELKKDIERVLING